MYSNKNSENKIIKKDQVKWKLKFVNRSELFSLLFKVKLMFCMLELFIVYGHVIIY